MTYALLQSVAVPSDQEAMSAPLPLSKHWSDHVRSGALHAISLAATSLTAAWSRAALRRSPLRDQAELDRLRAEITHLREEMAIKDTRWRRHSPRRRAHYDPITRMRILRLRAARGWTVAQTAERFLLTEATIMNWMRRLDEEGEAVFIRTEEPVNKYPDFVAYMVRHLKVISPALGKKRIADMLARAGLHLSSSTVRRMLKRDLTPEDATSVEPVPNRRIRAKRPGHTWHVDSTIVPTSGVWVPWLHHTQFQRWPFCWWVTVVVDHASRALVGVRVAKTRPTAAGMVSLLGKAIRTMGRAPKRVITDQGGEFDSWHFLGWCRRRSIRHSFGAIGEHGSIAVVERFIRSMKTECTRRVIVPFRIEQMRRELRRYEEWYNRHRPHTWLGGRTPDEVLHDRRPARDGPRIEPRPKWRGRGELQGDPGQRPELVLSYVGGRAHLPVVELRRAA